MYITFLKGFASFCILTGVLCTNLNIYPFNIYFQSVGAAVWVFLSYQINDKSMMLNFAPQIPLFVVGYLVIFFN